MSPPASKTAAILALWNDIAETRIDEYDRWHTLEHVPERVWVPGMIAGTRYVATAPGRPRYFTLYEMTSLAPLESPAYRDLVEHPTPWSASMRPAFSNFLRKPCTVEARAGRSTAAGLGILRVVWPRPVPPAGLAELCARLLTAGAGHHVTQAWLAVVAQAGPQAIANVPDNPPGHEYLVLVQTAAMQSLPLLAPLIEQTLRTSIGPPTWRQYSSYGFASRVTHDEVRQASRPSPRLDLMPA